MDFSDKTMASPGSAYLGEVPGMVMNSIMLKDRGGGKGGSRGGEGGEGRRGKRRRKRETLKRFYLTWNLNLTWEGNKLPGLA